MNEVVKVPTLLAGKVALVQSQNIDAIVKATFVEETVTGHDYKLSIVAPNVNLAALLLTGSGYRVIDIKCERLGPNVLVTALITIWNLD